MESKKQRRSPQHESHILGKCRRGCALCSVAVRSDRRRGAEVPCLTARALCTQPEVQKGNKPKQKNHTHKKKYEACPDLWRFGAQEGRRRLQVLETHAHACVRQRETLKCHSSQRSWDFFSDYRDLSEGVNGRSSKGGSADATTEEPISGFSGENGD